MINVTITKIHGDGSIPNSLRIGSICSLAISTGSVGTYEWEITTRPNGSNVYLSSPFEQTTKIGPFDKLGVYQIKAWFNRYASGTQTKIVAVSVAASPGALPPEPEINSGGRVNNWSFEVAGSTPGSAKDWTLRDDAGIISGAAAGVTRGRIIPTNFAPTDGIYAFCLGDDLGVDVSKNLPVYPGDVLSISQNIDFTRVKTLSIDLRYRK